MMMLFNGYIISELNYPNVLNHSPKRSHLGSFQDFCLLLKKKEKKSCNQHSYTHSEFSNKIFFKVCPTHYLHQNHCGRGGLF